MGRKRGSRFRKAIDAQEQLEGLEREQKIARKKKAGKLINSTDKSEQRFDNSLKKVRKPDEVPEEFQD